MVCEYYGLSLKLSAPPFLLCVKLCVDMKARRRRSLKFFAKLVIYHDIDVVCTRLNAFQGAIMVKIGLVTNIKYHFVALSPQNCLTLHEIYIYEV